MQIYAWADVSGFELIDLKSLKVNFVYSWWILSQWEGEYPLSQWIQHSKHLSEWRQKRVLLLHRCCYSFFKELLTGVWMFWIYQKFVKCFSYGKTFLKYYQFIERVILHFTRLRGMYQSYRDQSIEFYTANQLAIFLRWEHW